jgi:hypothetical protein
MLRLIWTLNKTGQRYAVTRCRCCAVTHGVTALRFEDFLDRPVGIVWRDRRVPLVVAPLLAGNMQTPLDVAHLEHLIPKNRAATSGQGVAPPSGARQATAGRAASRPDRPSRAFSDYYVNYTTFHGL